MSATQFLSNTVAKIRSLGSMSWSPADSFNHDVKEVQSRIPAGVRICHFPGNKLKGGYTVAWRKVTNFKNSRMIELSIAHCSKYDQFSKKIGTDLALEYMANGNVVVLPLRTNNTDSSIYYNIASLVEHLLMIEDVTG